MVWTCPFDSLADPQWHHIIIVINRPYLVISKFIGHFFYFKSQRKCKQKRTKRKKATKITSFLRYRKWISVAECSSVHIYKEYSEKERKKVTTNISFQEISFALNEKKKQEKNGNKFTWQKIKRIEAFSNNFSFLMAVLYNFKHNRHLKHTANEIASLHRSTLSKQTLQAINSIISYLFIKIFALFIIWRTNLFPIVYANLSKCM